MDIVEGNKLINDFLGNKLMRLVVDEERPLLKSGRERKVLMEVEPEEMEYHSSWDWLMPAWSKIIHFSQECASKEVNVTRHNSLCNRFESATANNDASKAFDVVVEAIKWYNIFNRIVQ